MSESTGYLRIGELSRRTGVSAERLRAWEQRYGLLRPARTEGGFRLYSDADELRVRSTVEAIAGGLSTAEAARRALSRELRSSSTPSEAAVDVVTELRTALRASLDAMDGEEAHAVFDRLLATLSVDAVMGGVVLPYLRELGERWASGEVTVAQEHFASNLIRGRLMGLARDWGAGDGPWVVLACPPGEAHELGLIVFGIEIARRGWRVTYLGADTPPATIEAAAEGAEPVLVVLAVTDVEHLRSHADAIRSLTRRLSIALGGAVTSEDARRVGAYVLDGDPIEAARSLASGSAIGRLNGPAPG